MFSQYGSVTLLTVELSDGYPVVRKSIEIEPGERTAQCTRLFVIEYWESDADISAEALGQTGPLLSAGG